jgi:hypothetical protein
MSSDSGDLKDDVHSNWSLHVGPLLVTVVALRVRGIANSCHSSQLRTGSWEFITSLHYEWDVIRGRQAYRWTLWVRDDKPLL